MNLLKNVWSLLKPYWTSSEKWQGFRLLGLTIFCVIVEIFARVEINDFSKDFYDALQRLDQTALIIALSHFLLAMILLVIALGCSIYFIGVLSIRWRKWLTDHYLQKWLNALVNFSHLDNPDQRISEDIEKFTASTLALFLLILHSIIFIIVFGHILWKLSMHLDFIVPGYLFWCALLYALTGSFLIAWIGKKLIKLDYQQQMYNANLRYALVKIRHHKEEIMLHRGEEQEHQHVKHIFQPIFNNFLQMTSLKTRLAFFNQSYNTISFVFGMVIAIPFYFHKKIQLGLLMQISGAFSYVVNAFSAFVNSFNEFSEWRAVIRRLVELHEAVKKQNETTLLFSQTNAPDIVIHDLNIFLPNQKNLLQKLSFTFKKGQKYLIEGPVGSGKSLFLKTLAGAWPYASGNIFFPNNAKILFLSQRPYIPQRSLRDVLLYPNTKVTDEYFHLILKLCHLEKWIDCLDENKDWSTCLSLGEQQLISFARIFLQKPDIVFLDEATSALNEITEVKMYENLLEFFPQLTVISIGHRHQLRRYHAQFISFFGQLALSVDMV